MPELGHWAAKQRVARQQGGLTHDRLLILESIGFDFGDEAQLTAEWEERFDQLLEWLHWQVRTRAAPTCPAPTPSPSGSGHCVASQARAGREEAGDGAGWGGS